eukprot:7280190-Pyramimonas_sp.AAC.1
MQMRMRCNREVNGLHARPPPRRLPAPDGLGPAGDNGRDRGQEREVHSQPRCMCRPIQTREQWP